MWQTFLQRVKQNADWLIGASLFLLTFAIYLLTLAPTVAEMFDDSLEFQLLAARMAIAHPTGYPLFSILLKLATFIPFGDIAYRTNFITALFAALAVVTLYAVARQFVASRVAAFIAALVFAFGETFWSQAVLTEVYTLYAFLTTVMLWLACAWGKWTREEDKAPDAIGGRASIVRRPSLVLLAFCAGLMLTHHRMSMLLFPALGIYILVSERKFLREPHTLLKLTIAFVLPLLLYLYIPLRGLATSSLDGTYQNTLAGFFNWVLASNYNVFLTQNPFNEQRDAVFYLDLFLKQFTWIGLVLAVLGFITYARRTWREWLLLTLGFAANLIFALNYRVADIQVFFIPTFLFVALFIALGLDALAQILSRAFSRAPKRAWAQIPILAFLLLPFALFQNNFPAIDLSGKWDVHDYAREVLSQPLPNNATIVGILGEMTLLRYFQETQNLRADVETVAADQEPARLAAIDAALQKNRTVFLTRPLSDVSKKYSLTSFGSLIQIQPKPNKAMAPAPAHALDENFDGVKLLGYDLDTSHLSDTSTWHLDNGRSVRFTLYWHVEKKVANNRFVSLKLLLPDGTRGAQLDRQPVLDAYPTTAWCAGEYIRDTYDLPVFIGAMPGEYTLQVALYDPESGNVFGQKDLEKIKLMPDTRIHPDELLGIEHLVHYDFGGVELVGYELDVREPYAAGDQIPLTLLWRVSKLESRAFELSLLDVNGRVIQPQSVSPRWESISAHSQYLRQEIFFALPASLPHGSFTLKLAASPRGNFPCESPLIASCQVLGQIEVKK